MAKQSNIEWCEHSVFTHSKFGPQPMPPRDGDRQQARQRINVLVRTGRLPHPNNIPCADCDHEWHPGERRHEYDHFHGYEPKHHYCVEPVCTTCHAERDSKRKAQTHCVNGHEFVGYNIIVLKNGTRRCRECRRIRDKKRRNAAYWRDYRSKKKAGRTLDGETHTEFPNCQ